MTQSAARTITIGAPSPFGGSGYGTMPAGAPNWFRYQPQPGEFLDYAVDVTAALDGEQITLAELSVKPAGQGEFQAAFLSVDGCALRFWGLAGVADRTNTIRLKVGTAQRTHVFLVGLKVSGALATFREPPPPIAGFGSPIMICQGQQTFQPALNLPAVTVAATGTTQLTAAPVPLAKVLVNAGPGGVSLPQAATFGGQTMVVFNRTGAVITIYPYAGDTIESNAANAGVVIQDENTAHFSVANSGLLIIS